LLLGAGLATVSRSRARGPAATMPEGTFFIATLEQSVSTAYARDGDPITLRTVHRVRLAEGGAVPARAVVRGEVARARRGAGAAAPELTLRLSAIVIDGHSFAISAAPLEVRVAHALAPRAAGRAFRLRAGGAATLAGRELTLPAGTPVRVRLIAPVRFRGGAVAD
jgi:hypothetical protein